jgi:predicted dehydrogenase
MLNVALVGCGTMAESHITHINRLPNAKLIAVCDSELLMAKQVTLLHNVDHYFDDIHQMIKSTRPDVIHIITPPDSHYSLAKICLENSIHTYVEKPFTLLYNEAEELINIANQYNVKVTVGHSAQFSDAAIELRNLMRQNFLGGKPHHMESIYCYNWGNENYAKFILNNPDHWLNRLPGKLFQEIISHGIAKISEFLDSDNPEVQAMAYKSPFLKKLGGNEIQDELRVIIKGNDSSAYFTFSGSLKPLAHSFKLYGPERAVELDHVHQTIISYLTTNSKSYLKWVKHSRNLAKQYKQNASKTIKRFLRNEIETGTYNLIKNFYDSIINNKDVPIPYNEILLTAKIMELIFKQVYPNEKFNVRE